MAIVKIKTAKRDIKSIIDYVTNPNKTNELLISGKDCSPETVVDEMEVVKEQYHKKDGNTYFHVIQSFSPNDNITPEKAHEVGVNFADYFKNYQVLIATHIDKNHIHNHLIVNSVSFENGASVAVELGDRELTSDRGYIISWTTETGPSNYSNLKFTRAGTNKRFASCSDGVCQIEGLTVFIR